MPHQVLIFGHESLLLKTRELLLMRAGFDVCASDRTDAAHEILAARAFDLLILCHSLRPQERSAIIATARAFQKNVAILVLLGDDQNPPISANVTVFRTLDGPYDFLRTVCRLTHEPAPPLFGLNSPNPGKELCHDLQVR